MTLHGVASPEEGGYTNKSVGHTAEVLKVKQEKQLETPRLSQLECWQGGVDTPIRVIGTHVEGGDRIHPENSRKSG